MVDPIPDIREGGSKLRLQVKDNLAVDILHACQAVQVVIQTLTTILE